MRRSLLTVLLAALFSAAGLLVASPGRGLQLRGGGHRDATSPSADAVFTGHRWSPATSTTPSGR